MKINDAAFALCSDVIDRAASLRVGSHRLACQAQILDFGIHVPGGIAAGLRLAEICMSGLASISISPPVDSIFPSPQVAISTDDPVRACMASQYAGWPIKHGDFFAMGSGAMRAKRGREHVLDSLGIQDTSQYAVGVLETDALPDESVCQAVADDCKTPVDRLVLCVAPTRSLAGTIQVVARSVETSLHKLFELGFDLRQIVSAHGTAPLPPPAIDFAIGIGRTNDAILYGGHVTLWVNADDAQIESIFPKVPSHSSGDWGQPFAKTFKKYDYDFYKVDPGLFSPAVVSVCNFRSGKSWRFGVFRPDVLADSFGTLHDQA